MRRFCLTKIGLISASCLAIGCSTVSLSGCNQHTKNSISFYKKEFYVRNRNISLPFDTTIKAGTLLHVNVINEESESIDIVNNDFTIQSDSNAIDIVIAENVKTKRTFYFSLEFSFPNESLEKIEISQFVVHFSYHPEDDDGLRADNNHVINHNDYVFNFAIQFQYRPETKVKVELKKDISLLLSLESWGNEQEKPVYTKEYTPTHREHWYYVDIPVYMKVSVFSQFTAPFALDFTFINSKGREQKTTIDNLAGTLLYHVNDKIPEDFFEIVTKDDGMKHLIGFKRGISPYQIKQFSVLEIPDSVEVVDPYVFDDEFFFDRIVLGKNLKEFRSNSLFKCNGMSMIDASKAENITKFSAEEGKPVFNPNLFEHSGVVIVPTCVEPDDYEKWKEAFESQGFIQEKDWEIYQENLVVPDSQYIIDYNEEKDMYKLTGITGSNLSQYAVIRMPLQVTNIDIDAFANLIEQPYLGPEKNECRFLSISPMVDSFSGYAQEGKHTFFSGLNLRGLINIPKMIQKLPDNCFYKITQDTPNHKLDIVFNKNSTITQLGFQSLASNSITNIAFPNTITTVDASLLEDCKMISSMDFRSYGGELPEWLDSTPDHSDTSLYFKNVGLSVVGKENKGKIIVTNSSLTEDDWQNWFTKHGLSSVRDNWVIERV